MQLEAPLLEVARPGGQGSQGISSLSENFPAGHTFLHASFSVIPPVTPFPTLFNVVVHREGQASFSFVVPFTLPYFPTGHSLGQASSRFDWPRMFWFPNLPPGQGLGQASVTFVWFTKPGFPNHPPGQRRQAVVDLLSSS